MSYNPHYHPPLPLTAEEFEKEAHGRLITLLQPLTAAPSVRPAVTGITEELNIITRAIYAAATEHRDYTPNSAHHTRLAAALIKYVTPEEGSKPCDIVRKITDKLIIPWEREICVWLIVKRAAPEINR